MREEKTCHTCWFHELSREQEPCKQCTDDASSAKGLTGWRDFQQPPELTLPSAPRQIILTDTDRGEDDHHVRVQAFGLSTLEILGVLQLAIHSVVQKQQRKED